MRLRNGACAWRASKVGPTPGRGYAASLLQVANSSTSSARSQRLPWIALHARAPRHADLVGRKAKRQAQHDEPQRAGCLLGQRLGHRDDEIGGARDVGGRGEVRQAQRDVTAHAHALQLLVETLVSAALGHDHRVPRFRVAARRERLVRQWMPGPHQADVALQEELAAEHVRPEVDQRADREVRASGHEVVGRRRHAEPDGGQRDAGRLRADPHDEARQEEHLAQFRHREREGPLRGRGLEPLHRRQRLAERGERRGERRGQRLHVRGGRHAAPGRGEERIAERRPQAFQAAGRRGLREPERLRGRRHRPRALQRLQQHEQVEVEVAEIAHLAILSRL